MLLILLMNIIQDVILLNFYQLFYDIEDIYGNRGLVIVRGLLFFVSGSWLSGARVRSFFLGLSRRGFGGLALRLNRRFFGYLTYW